MKKPITKEEIAKAVKVNLNDTNVKSVIFHFIDKKGVEFTREYGCVAMDENGWCRRTWDLYGMKHYGSLHSYGNVTSIEFVYYKEFRDVVLQEVDLKGNVLSETPIKLGK